MFTQKLFEELSRRFFKPEFIVNIIIKFINCGLIVILTIIIYRIIATLLCRYARKHKQERVQTLIPLINSILKYVAFFLALVAILRELGVNYGAILAGAGVVGLAVGFGAQTLIRDFISGFFIIFEDLIRIGDVITVGNETGTVEKIGLRTTQYREFSGVLRTIPNGELTRFGNFSRDYMRAIVSVDFDYNFDINRAFNIMKEIAELWAQENQEIILEPPEVHGIVGFTKAGITFRIVAKVKPQYLWQSERDLRYRIKVTFDKLNIPIPLEQQTIHLKK
ncbi:MAG: mechanosensitive ion channel family protein [candidate division WOR-3 bacterium]|nr:mechanosensitive ion channel family protein [candidate division WOR-3 bacterium]